MHFPLSVVYPIFITPSRRRSSSCHHRREPYLHPHVLVSSSVLLPQIHTTLHQEKTAHFLPLFLMPCAPVLSGPFLPDAAFAASAFAFFSGELSVVVSEILKCRDGFTSRELHLVGLVLLILLNNLLLGLLVVDWVGAGCLKLAWFRPLWVAERHTSSS